MFLPIRAGSGRRLANSFHHPGGRSFPISEANLRIARAADTEEIAGLIDLLARENGETTAVTPEYVRSYLACPGQGVFLAEAGGRICGILSCSMRPGLYHAAPSLVIEELVVYPEYRGKGFGKLLVAAAVAAKSGRCAEISVSTGLENRPAQGLYKGMGLVDEALLLEMHLEMER